MPDLTPNEYPQAEKLAYQKCLARGHGREPPYNPEAAVGDFWQAAGEVIAQRQGQQEGLMDAIDFFNSDELELPRARNTDDFEAFLDTMYQGYLGRFAQLQTADYVTQQIAGNLATVTTLCNRVRDAVRHYLRGLPHLAFNEIDFGIQAVNAHFNRLCTPINVAATMPLQELYRIRTAGPMGANFQRPDLYHIPFDKRHLITRQRYSLPGLPCLYLGGTLWIAWEETGRPSFDTVYYARFRPQANAHLTYLDFGYRPALMAAMIDANQPACQAQSELPDFAVAQGVCWPILAACSIRRKHGDSPFIAEYVVPQLILQWITNSNVHDGIRYFSVNLPAYINNPAMACNYVFPARQSAAQGHCATLRAKFEMSPPLSWQIVQQMGMPHGMGAGMPIHGNSVIPLVAGAPINYIHTPFGQIEAKSIGYPCASF
jgi:hypothetical protein